MIAIINYHDSQGALPMVRSWLVAAHGPYDAPWSIRVILFPYYEQEARYEDLVSAGKTTNIKPEIRSEHTHGIIPVLLYPSDGESTKPSWGRPTEATLGGFGRANIVASRGN